MNTSEPGQQLQALRIIADTIGHEGWCCFQRIPAPLVINKSEFLDLDFFFPTLLASDFTCLWARLLCPSVNPRIRFSIQRNSYYRRQKSTGFFLSIRYKSTGLFLSIRYKSTGSFTLSNTKHCYDSMEKDGVKCTGQVKQFLSSQQQQGCQQLYLIALKGRLNLISQDHRHQWNYSFQFTSCQYQFGSVFLINSRLI